jgi:RNA polymerase sigma-70 factor (ECF subfamily)
MHMTSGSRALTPVPQVTGLLMAWGNGDRAALDALIPLVQGELRRLARHHMAGERPGHSLQPTALVHEAYLRLVDVRQVRWQNRAHFFALAARLMRRILVDRARARRYQKRGGGARQVSFDEALAVSMERGEDLIAVDEALVALTQLDPRRGQVVELRFFGGLTVEETAEALKISQETVMRDWKLARVWLARALEQGRRDA